MSRSRGSVAVVVAGSLGLVALLTLWLASLGVVLGARQAAQTAADAAALAAAPVTFLPFGAKGTPAEEARRFAALNGARLERCSCDVDPSFATRSVEVTVGRSVDLPVVGSVVVTATGRAEFSPARLLEAATASG